MLRTIWLCALLIGWALPAFADGNAVEGRKVSIIFCARCHVIGDYNRYGGIDSTPSFQLLARRDDVEDLVRTCDARPVPGVPRRSNAPAYASEFMVTPGDIENLVVFVLTHKNWKRR